MATPTAPPAPRRELVLGAAAAMVTAHLIFRAWAVYPAYFYGDDFRLVRESGREPLSLELLLQPYDSQFMPLGRFVAWIGAAPDQLSWPLLATTSLVMQAFAAAACVWMLVTLFGHRWGVLAPLALYLSTAMTLPAFLWWAAALNQVPLQAVFFAAVAAWVRYLRSRRLTWLALTVLLLAVGLSAYVKTLLLFPVLAFLALGWFATGGPERRVVTVVRRYWPAAVAGVAGGAAFLAYYATAVPQMTTGEPPEGAAALADQMVGTAFTTALIGGPWRWDDRNPPVGLADPPGWTVHLSWVVVTLVVAYLALGRERTLRAWVLLAGYVAADYVLLLTTRAQIVGTTIGTEYRYLTDAACAAVLALGLASMGLRGADQPSASRSEPLLTRPVARWVVVAATVAVTLSGLWSSASYARLWHDHHPAKEYLTAAVDSINGMEEVDLADQEVPDDVMAPFAAPYHTTETLLPMLTSRARFPTSTDRLHVLDESGRVELATVDGIQAPQGPTEGCGWLIRGSGRTISLPATTVELTWWLEIGYLASADSAVTVEAGSTRVTADLYAGLGTVLVEVEGAVDDVRLGGLDPGVTMCVDSVEVGAPVPVGEAR